MLYIIIWKYQITVKTQHNTNGNITLNLVHINWKQIARGGDRIATKNANIKIKFFLKTF